MSSGRQVILVDFPKELLIPPDPQPPPCQAEPPNPDLDGCRTMFLGVTGGCFVALLCLCFSDTDSGPLGELEYFLAHFLWFDTLGALGGAMVASLFIANARQQERWRREDQARAEQREEQDRK